MKKRYPFLPKTWLYIGLTAAFAVSFSLNLPAQTAPAKQWDKAFGGNSSDMVYSVKQTPDGGFILGGTSGSGISSDKSHNCNGLTDFWFVKLNPNGTKLWDKTFGGSDSEVLTSLELTSDGGYIAGGYSNTGVNGDKTQASLGMHDYWILKLDANGNKIWDKTFGGAYNDHLTSLKQTADGGYFLGGYSDSGITGDKSQANQGGVDYWVIKLDANGIKQWDRTFGGNATDELTSIQQTSDGGYFLGGFSGSGLNGDKSQNYFGSIARGDYWVVKLDAAGNKQWDKTLGGDFSENLYSVQQTTDGGYILGGHSDSGISGNKSHAINGLSTNYDYWIVKLDANGNKLWDKSLGGNSIDYFSTLQQTSDGGYLLGGRSISGISNDKSEANKGSWDYWLIKTDANGIKLWDKSLGGTESEFLASLSQTSDGGYIVGGGSISGISGDKTQPCQGTADFWAVKLAASPTGLKESEASFSLSISPNPNPNQGKFRIQLTNLTTPKIEATVFDLLGRVVLQKEFQTANNQLSEELILPNAKGIYMLQLKAGNQIITRKIVVE